MPAIAPSEFVAKAEAKGFLFSLKPDGSLGVKPPAPDAMTDKVRQYVREQKADLVSLIAAREAPPGELPKITQIQGSPQPEESFEKGRKRPKEADSEALPGESTAPLKAIPVGALYPDEQRQSMIDWAMIHVKAGTLPVPSIPIFLPSGKRIEGEMASRFLLEGHERALRLCSIESQSAHEAFLLLRQDLRHVASWCAKEWHVLKWIEDSVSPHLDHLGELWEADTKMAKERSFIPARVEAMV